MHARGLGPILLVTGCVVAGCAAPGPQEPPAPPRAPKALDVERAAARVAAAHGGGDALWPGFDLLAVPLAVYDGERTVLFRHPAPPEGFGPDREDPTASVYEGRHGAVAANSSAQIGGVSTATVLLDVPGRSAADLAALAVHEAFHVLQRERHPAWAGNEADLFVYPVDDPVLLARRRLETEALRRALVARDPGAAAGVVAGLSEPALSEVDGAVTVAAPGFQATFRGASVIQAGIVLTIRLLS